MSFAGKFLGSARVPGSVTHKPPTGKPRYFLRHSAGGQKTGFRTKREAEKEAARLNARSARVSGTGKPKGKWTVHSKY